MIKNFLILLIFLSKIYLILLHYFIFEGEYINGLENGYGKEYYKNWNIIFEGKYLNGKINGKGKI